MTYLLAKILISGIVLTGSITNTQERGWAGYHWHKWTHRVLSVIPDSPAQKAGLLAWDKLKYVDGSSEVDFYREAGEDIDLTVERDHQLITMKIHLVPASELKE